MISTTSPAAYAVYEPLDPVEPPDSPLPGMFARAPDGRKVLLVDRTAVVDWPGWGAEGEPHLLAPIDVVRRADGHDVVVPALTERVDAFLVRRADAAAPLSNGEAITLAVSVVRGLAPSLARAGEIEGEWWLAEDGRPLLVEGVGDVSTGVASAEIIAGIGEAFPRSRLGAALRDLADASLHPGFTSAAAEWEERLFGCADPEPLVTQVFGPLRARRLAHETKATDEPPPRSLWQRLAFHADADLAAAASDALTVVLHRVRRSRSPRRPLQVASGIAGVIVVAGLLWPTGSDDAVPTAAVATGVPTHSATAEPATTAAPISASPDDLAAVTAELLDRRNACTDTACLAGVLEDPANDLPHGAIDEAGDRRSVSLLDDLGGLVVVRVDSLQGLPMQIVTVVETEDGWRIRDVHDVTDAPS
ncbi:hypothetical protein ACFXQA_10080 [Microbacterium sp. P07]|uniref:hypothetical protein n=1 Tax=Microbacterium sp. P07 TaxID=3366952 RepID=UPI00374698EE